MYNPYPGRIRLLSVKSFSFIRQLTVVAIVVLELLFVFPHPVFAADDSQQIRRIFTRIVPQQLDDSVVYPTNFATIPLDLFTEYKWKTLELPHEWSQTGYRFELWDSRNTIIPGFDSQVLQGSSIDISSIDASVYPQVRIVLFQPEGIASFDYIAPVTFTYIEQQNIRLFVFLGLIALIDALLLVAAVRYRIGSYELFQETVALLRRRSPVVSIRQVVVYALLIELWSGVFGVTLAQFIGGIQVVYILIKLPFLFIGAFLFTISSNILLSSLLGVKASMQEMITRSLSVLATTALVLASFSPIILFYIFIPQTHDELLVSTVLFFAISCMLGVVRFYQWLKEVPTAIPPLITVSVWAVVYGVVVLQLGWLLRPWIGVVDPVIGIVPFSRLYGGNVFVELANAFFRL